MNNNRSITEHGIADIEISDHTLGDSETHVIDIYLYNAHGERVNQIILFGIDSEKIKIILNGE